MPSSSSAARTIVWAGIDQQPLIREAANSAGLEVIAVGGHSANASADLAKGLGVERIDDIRSITRRDDVDLVWVADPEPLDPQTLRLLRESGVRMIASEPNLACFGE